MLLAHSRSTSRLRIFTHGSLRYGSLTYSLSDVFKYMRLIALLLLLQLIILTMTRKTWPQSTSILQILAIWGTHEVVWILLVEMRWGIWSFTHLRCKSVGVSFCRWKVFVLDCWFWFEGYELTRSQAHIFLSLQLFIDLHNWLHVATLGHIDIVTSLRSSASIHHVMLILRESSIFDRTSTLVYDSNPSSWVLFFFRLLSYCLIVCSSEIIYSFHKFLLHIHWSQLWIVDLVSALNFKKARLWTLHLNIWRICLFYRPIWTTFLSIFDQNALCSLITSTIFLLIVFVCSSGARSGTFQTYSSLPSIFVKSNSNVKIAAINIRSNIWCSLLALTDRIWIWRAQSFVVVKRDLMRCHF